MDAVHGVAFQTHRVRQLVQVLGLRPAVEVDRHQAHRVDLRLEPAGNLPGEAFGIDGRAHLFLNEAPLLLGRIVEMAEQLLALRIVDHAVRLRRLNHGPQHQAGRRVLLGRRRDVGAFVVELRVQDGAEVGLRLAARPRRLARDLTEQATGGSATQQPSEQAVEPPARAAQIAVASGAPHAPRALRRATERGEKAAQPAARQGPTEPAGRTAHAATAGHAASRGRAATSTEKAAQATGPASAPAQGAAELTEQPAAGSPLGRLAADGTAIPHRHHALRQGNAHGNLRQSLHQAHTGSSFRHRRKADTV